MMTQLQKDLCYVVGIAVALPLMIEELVVGWSTLGHRIGLILIPCFTCCIGGSSRYGRSLAMALTGPTSIDTVLMAPPPRESGRCLSIRHYR